MTVAVRSSFRGSALPLATVALPLLAAVYQVAATMAARACASAPGPAAWVLAAVATPWSFVLIASEIASFAIWTAVLARMPLSRAFPITAIGYILVVSVATLVLHEPLRPASLLGTAAILAGAALLASDAP